MLLLSIMFLSYERPWTAARNAVRGQPGSPYTPPANAWHHLGSARPRNISRCHWFFCRHIPSCLLEMKIFFIWKRPRPQQGSNSVMKEHAKLCRIEQMMVGSLCTQPGFTQESTFFKKDTPKGKERKSGFSFFLANLNLLTTSVKPSDSFHSLRVVMEP